MSAIPLLSPANCNMNCSWCFSYFSSGIFLQTTTICPVFESILVVTGRQRQDTVFAFSSFVTTQCSISSAFGGGVRLRITRVGAEGVAAGLCLDAQPTTNRRDISHAFLIRIIRGIPRGSTIALLAPPAL